jgi:putative transposase
MPRCKLRATLEEVKALRATDQNFLRPLVQAVLQELLEAEMTEALGAAKGERRWRGSAIAAATTIARW